MPRETKTLKAERYLAEGRVIVTDANRALVAAQVRGDGAVYRTGWRDGLWSCSCPHRASSTDCSHIAALKRVTAVDVDRGRGS